MVSNGFLMNAFTHNRSFNTTWPTLSVNSPSTSPSPSKAHETQQRPCLEVGGGGAPGWLGATVQRNCGAQGRRGVITSRGWVKMSCVQCFAAPTLPHRHCNATKCQISHSKCQNASPLGLPCNRCHPKQQSDSERRAQLMSLRNSGTDSIAHVSRSTQRRNAHEQHWVSWV